LVARRQPLARSPPVVLTIRAFLAIEDEQGRAALFTLAERVVSYDWVGKAQ
jgi:hypothetical protein